MLEGESFLGRRVTQHFLTTSCYRNAEVRMIMFRLLKLMASGCSPLIVFDGPGRPSWKRGNYISGSGRSAVERQVEALCNVLKIPCVRARGEAEAEMAAMNKRGVIDAVCSDDVDTLLFGASLVSSSLFFSYLVIES